MNLHDLYPHFKGWTPETVRLYQDLKAPTGGWRSTLVQNPHNPEQWVSMGHPVGEEAATHERIRDIENEEAWICWTGVQGMFESEYWYTRYSIIQRIDPTSAAILTEPRIHHEEFFPPEARMDCPGDTWCGEDWPHRNFENQRGEGRIRRSFEWYQAALRGEQPVTEAVEDEDDFE